MKNADKQRKLIVFTAPSGAGKTTIVEHLISVFPQLGFSVSATTRNQRKSEKDGKHYHFLNQNEFLQKVRNGEFAEFEEVYKGQFYGTLKSEIERLWANKKVALFDIDVKGAVKIKSIYGDQCMCVFIRPPSLQVLIDRLKKRKSDSEESLRRRIRKAKDEMTYENQFDKVLVNDLLKVAMKEAEIFVEDFLDLNIT